MIFNIILKFSPVVQFGVTESIQRKVPILIAKDKTNLVRTEQNNAFSFSLTMGTLLLLAFVSLGPSLSGIENIFIYLFAPVLLLNLISYNIGIVFRSHNQFKKVGIASFLSGFYSLISIVLAYQFSFTGFLIGQLIRYTLTFVTHYAINEVKLSFELNIKYIKELIRDGMPILLIVISSYMVTLSDRIIIAYYFDAKYLGLYGLAYLLINPFIFIAGSVNSVLYTSFSTSYGKNENFLTLNRILRYTKFLVFIFSASIGLIYVLLPLITSIFLPDYTDGINSAKWLLIGHIFMFSSGIMTNAYLTLRKQNSRLLLILMALFVNLAVSLILLEIHLDIISVAIGSLCSFIFLFWGLLVGLNFMDKSKSKKQLKDIWLLIIFLIGSIAIIITVGEFQFDISPIGETILKSFIFIIIYLIWGLLFNKSELKKLVHESIFFNR